MSLPTVPRASRAHLDKRPDEIAAMFDGVAERYDRTNTILSFGRDRAWRHATREALDLTAGERVLDLARRHRRVHRGAGPVAGRTWSGVDISQGMLRAGKRTRPRTTLLAGDALALPFRGRHLRRGHHLVRPAQRARHRRRAARDGAGHQAGRPAGGLRVLAPDQRGVPARVPRCT